MVEVFLLQLVVEGYAQPSKVVVSQFCEQELQLPSLPELFEGP